MVHESVDQGGLANARFACDKPNLTLAPECSYKPLLELGEFRLSPYERARRR
jgi:hypothetical protein